MQYKARIARQRAVLSLVWNLRQIQKSYVYCYVEQVMVQTVNLDVRCTFSAVQGQAPGHKYRDPWLQLLVKDPPNALLWLISIRVSWLIWKAGFLWLSGLLTGRHSRVSFFRGSHSHPASVHCRQSGPPDSHVFGKCSPKTVIMQFY